MHQPPRIRIERIPTVHRGTVVPQDEVAHLPLLVPGELRLAGMGPQAVQQVLALVERQPDDVAIAAAPKEEGVPVRRGMGADERMDRSRCLAWIGRSEERRVGKECMSRWAPER